MEMLCIQKILNKAFEKQTMPDAMTSETHLNVLLLGSLSKNDGA